MLPPPEPSPSRALGEDINQSASTWMYWPLSAHKGPHSLQSPTLPPPMGPADALRSPRPSQSVFRRGGIVGMA